MNFLLVGNPNVGKTSLYNHITGSRARVGNYPGVTVERRFAKIKRQVDGEELSLTVTDAPGTYSLVARSSEEQIVINAVLGLAGVERPDVVIAVVNATQLSRNMYLVLQLLELRVRTIIALNMVDEAGPGSPSAEELAERLGIPVVATNGDTGAGAEQLLAQAVRLARSEKPPLPRLSAHYPAPLRALADSLAERLPQELTGRSAGEAIPVERTRALAMWALMSVSQDDELTLIPHSLRDHVSELTHSYASSGSPEEGAHAVDEEVITARYAAIDALLKDLLHADAAPSLSVAERVDRVLLHPLSGGLAFLLTMLVVFQSLFAWSDPAIGWIESLVTFLQEQATALLPPGLLADLVVEGVLGGVGNVIVFLPQILLLFLFVGLLEDSGYMARVAYLMDRVMRSLGLHGRAFVPLLSGFACAVPAILATRTLERRRDRLLTMMVVPLMTCSARLPVYTLIIAALFPIHSDGGWPVQGLLMVGLYLFSMVTALVAAAVLGRTVIPGKSVPLILELPPYRLPRIMPTVRMMQMRAGQFLNEAGTVILAATVVLWALLSFPRVGAEQVAAHTTAASVAVATTEIAAAPPQVGDAPALEDSYAGRMGKALEPAMAPLGFDWKITTGIIGAFAAREVFVSTLGLVFGMGDLDDEAAPLRDRIRHDKNPDGSPAYTPLMGLSLLVFFALACQCMSTLAVVKRESHSYRWPAFLFVYMTALAYLCSLVIYQGGRLFGF